MRTYVPADQSEQSCERLQGPRHAPGARSIGDRFWP